MLMSLGNERDEPDEDGDTGLIDDTELPADNNDMLLLLFKLHTPPPMLLLLLLLLLLLVLSDATLGNCDNENDSDVKL